MYKYIIIISILISAIKCYGQGSVSFVILPDYRTRIGSENGPFADERYFGQLLAGRDESALTPVGLPLTHIQAKNPSGAIVGGIVIIDGIRAFELATLQFVAWDQTVWGDNVLNVPDAYLGKSPKIEILLAHPAIGISLPTVFPSGAVVPIIPECKVHFLVLAGGFLIYLRKLKMVL